MTKKKNGKKLVKLYLYRHESKETVVDGIKATDWGDFLVVAINTAEIPEESILEIQEIFSRYNALTEKEVLLVPREWNLEFYGIEIDGSETE